ncbi:MAG TPA: zinc-ribbon domain-containing protein [Polyangiaceae bacterium]
MKITCQSCQSKYNVADEKVQGKIVKIRCRKCGATIVVNGTGGDAAATNGATAGAAGGAQWHVNLGDSDQRTMSMPELVDAYNAGVVTQDTFIWTDGMDDWKPLAEVEQVVSALHASAGQMAIGTPGAFETPGYDAAAAAPAPAADVGDYGGGGGAYAASAAPAAEPKRAAVAKREARGRDLFATNVGDEIQTSAPVVPEAMAAAPGAAPGPTGQRNENSVLFSLAVLTKNADQRAPQNETTANKEDSGLIDLKALAAKAESVRPPAGAADHDVFTAPIGGFGAPLGAPVGALSPLGTPETQPKSKLPLYIGGGGGMLVLLVLGIVIGVKLAGPSPVPAAASIVTTVAPPSATVDPSAAASASAAPEASASAAPSASVASKPKYGGGSGGGYHPPPRPGGGSGAVGGSGGASPTPPPAPAPKKGGGDCGCNGDLMCLMKCSTH